MLKSQYPMPVVEKQTTKNFMWQIAQTGLQIGLGVGGRLQNRTAREHFAQVPASHLQHGIELRVLGRPQPRRRAQRIGLGREQWAQAAEARQQFARDIHGGFAGDAGA